MTLEEARKILLECDAYLGAALWVPEGTNPESVIAIDGTLSVVEIEALLTDMKARMAEVTA